MITNLHPNSCPTVVAPLTTKNRDIREFRVQEKSVFSVPSVGVETSDNNKRIAKRTLLLDFSKRQILMESS